MGYLSHTSCYLVGPIENDSGYGKDWRVVVNDHLAKFGITIYNPLARPQWMKPIEDCIPPVVSREEVLRRLNSKDKTRYDQAQQTLRQACLRYVHTCDFVICYLSAIKTYGSVEELAIATGAGKPVLLVCPNDMPSLWLYDMVRRAHAFKTINEMITFLHGIDEGKQEIDALEWIFIGDSYELKSLNSDRC